LNQQNFILSRKKIYFVEKKIPVFFYSRGQQSKGLDYDAILEFFDEINPQVS
jgi:hypothetical protein